MPLGTIDDDYGPPTPELSLLLRLRDSGDEDFNDALSDLGYRLLAADDAPTLLHPDSYLSPAERADPSIAANIVAIDEVRARISFFAEDDQSNLFGYWHGPERTALAAAPIVKFDNEGQFALLQGRGLIEALIGDRVFDDDEAFAEHAQSFQGLGFAVAARNWHELADPDAASDPAQCHEAGYERALPGFQSPR
jgi:hypothetical protein